MPDKIKFTFIAHWVETWNWLLWFSRDLHHNPNHAWRWVWAWPIYTSASVIYLLRRKGHDRVDKFHFNNDLVGETVLIRNFGWHFFLANSRKKIKGRILKAVLAAQGNGAKVVGLGALTKAEWLTKGGQWIVDKLGNRLIIPIVHGDTLTAATVINNVIRIIERYQLNSPIFITGATSKIGRAVTLDLASRGMVVHMYSDSQERFESIRSESGRFAENVLRAKSLNDGKNCSIWITGKAIPKGKKLLRSIPSGAFVINFSVPNPIREKEYKFRTDLTFVEGGLLAYDPSQTDLSFTMRLTPGVTYACHAGTMVHARMGWTNHEVTHVDMNNLWKVWDASEKLGFFLPEKLDL
jgi:predicted amino acid dehydrogenase